MVPGRGRGAHPDDPADIRPEVSQSRFGNLVEKAEAAGYDYAGTAEELEGSEPEQILGLFANEELFEQRPEGQGDEYAPVVPLQAMTAKALDVLSGSRKGFFLLVEEEGIDETVALIKNFAEHHPGPLVVVGDHETGVMAIENVDPDDESGDTARSDPAVAQSVEDGPFPIAGSELEFVVDWTTGGHTGAATPLTAQGPRSERLARAQENSNVFDVVLEAMRRGR